ncbi:MFS general substrate transporter [Testicularia cyperi]|uniref:MFS general substrate transporter n=1 Tax=Testicularia cyperi TaxID=1882483 RepID=A0A317XZN5_9BASI|nr:MFS general substrate transporter [Testicularia cyperi]
MTQTVATQGLPRQLSAQERSALKRRKIISLLGSVCVSLSAGSNYAFSSFAPQLQESLHLTSTQINLIGIAGNAGVYLSSPFWGRFIDKRGPRLALISGAILVPIGYAGLSASYTGEWSMHSTSLLFFLNLLTGLGNSGSFTAAMNAQAKSWDGTRRGTATALVLSGFGLSAFFYSSLSHLLFPGNTGDYLLLLAFGSMTSMIIGLALVRIIPTPLEPPAGSASSASPTSPTRGYLRRRTSSDIRARATIWDHPESLSAEQSDDEDESRRNVAGGSQSRATAIAHRHTLAQEADGNADDGVDPEARGLLTGRDESKSRHSSSAGKQVSPETTDISGRELFKQLDFFLIFFLMTLVSGAGLLLINNVGTITKTLWDYNHRNDTTLLAATLIPRSSLVDMAGAPAAMVGPATASTESQMQTLKLSAKSSVQQLQAHQVSAISLCNCAGRILIGLLSDYLVNRTGNAAKRVWLLIVVTTLAFSSQVLAATPDAIQTVDQLLSVSVLTGLAYGTLFGICPVLVFEWFGMAHFSQNYGFVSLSPVVAGNIFNLLFGRIYDSHVPKDGTNNEINTILSLVSSFQKGHGHKGDGGNNDAPSHNHLCMQGEECYRQVFVITSAGCAVAIVLSIILIARRAGLPNALLPNSFRR